MTTVTAGYTPGDHHPDPFAADHILFTITAANAEQYRERLSPGQLALLKYYPSYKIPVYPTHRSASYPAQIYQGTLANATRATLAPDADALSGAIRGFPFPIPHSGREVIWNHLLRYRGHQMAWTSVEITTTAQGPYALTKVDQQALFPYFTPGATSESLSNILLYYRRIIRSPASRAGQAYLLHETLNQVDDPRRAWIYVPGQRRVLRAPHLAYDAPVQEAIRTRDQCDMFNGATDRYHWTLRGK
jgi:hypothetical protein